MAEKENNEELENDVKQEEKVENKKVKKEQY